MLVLRGDARRLKISPLPSIKYVIAFNGRLDVAVKFRQESASHVNLSPRMW